MQTKFTELSDSQWEIIEKFFLHHRPRLNSMRTILNAILWMTRNGAPWRNLESQYPKWEGVYYY
ncbi:MAG: transposase, partial [Bacteroidia bacterium]|nr:transposase [Bacteroidia bacterium]MDX1907481.1 transposase [Bacteroidia bacterium]